jgi:hypothetical protein
MTTSNCTTTSTTRFLRLFWTLALVTVCPHWANAFIVQKHSRVGISATSQQQQQQQQQHQWQIPLKLSSSNNNEERYSREVRLREEAESPFRKVRYFLYLNVGAGAFISFLLSAARIAAALAGVNTDLMEESVRNAVIDAIGLGGVGYFYRQDQISEESRLKRATKGAELAKLTVRASKSLLMEGEMGTFTTTIASFRRQRGIEKRVVIAAAGKDKIQQVLEESKMLQDELSANDLVIVPVVMPQGVSPPLSESELEQLANIAIPVSVGNTWKLLLDDEASEAISQGVDIEKDGFCVVLKKNGRVGQRTKGIFLNNLVGNVVARAEAGMDVKNI